MLRSPGETSDKPWPDWKLTLHDPERDTFTAYCPNNGKPTVYQGIPYFLHIVFSGAVSTKITSLRKKGKKAVVKWKKSSKVSGYEIQYSTSKKFKNSRDLLQMEQRKNSKNIIADWGQVLISSHRLFIEMEVWL